jgi:hypothetical protein
VEGPTLFDKEKQNKLNLSRVTDEALTSAVMKSFNTFDSAKRSDCRTFTPNISYTDSWEMGVRGNI